MTARTPVATAYGARRGPRQSRSRGIPPAASAPTVTGLAGPHDRHVDGPGGRTRATYRQPRAARRRRPQEYLDHYRLTFEMQVRGARRRAARPAVGAAVDAVAARAWCATWPRSSTRWSRRVMQRATSTLPKLSEQGRAPRRRLRRRGRRPTRSWPRRGRRGAPRSRTAEELASTPPDGRPRREGTMTDGDTGDARRRRAPDRGVRPALRPRRPAARVHRRAHRPVSPAAAET